MALATSPADTTRAPASGLVVAVRPSAGRTIVTIRTGADQVVTAEVPAVPDARAARKVAAAHRRLLWQRIELDGAVLECRVRGVRHRLPSETTLGPAAALALAADGLPTVLHVRGGG